MLRRLARDDMDEAATVLRESFDHALPTLAGLHTPAEDRWFFRERLFSTTLMWGAFEDGRMLAIMALGDDWIEQFYVRPAAQRAGIGGQLIEVAKRDAPVLNLWTFQRNVGARRFYERHGFALVELTDGARNEEKEPDAHYRWTRS